mgnify:FL=1|tara:strand:- start:765 stop:1541 length:777 start_codon:yes stop_codon:yes gene_type:complete
MLNKLPLECIENILNNMNTHHNSFNTSLGYIYTYDYYNNSQITHINFVNILKLSLVSKPLYDILSQDDIWYPLLIRDFRKGKYYKRKPKHIKNYYISRTILPKTIKYYNNYKLQLEKHLYSKISEYQNRKIIENTIKDAFKNERNIFSYFPYHLISERNKNNLIKSSYKLHYDDEHIFNVRKRNKSSLNHAKLNCMNSHKKYKHIFNVLQGIYLLINLKDISLTEDKEYFKYLFQLKYIEDIKPDNKYEYKNYVISVK